MALAKPLTGREQQVVALIARGYSNRQIADELVIALSTAERHVANILAKLEVATRTDIAVWALNHGPALADQWSAAKPQSHSLDKWAEVEWMHNLPAGPNRLIGRQKELQEIAAKLGQTRLLTLVGAGGVGKTRLALEAARDLAQAYWDGAWLIEFAPITAPHLIPDTVALVLGLREGPKQSLADTLVEALRPKHLLLVFDNCEHLIRSVGSLVDALIRHCPSLHILATSREPLCVEGEMEYWVPPLAVPNPTAESLSPEELLEFGSVRLFAERAAAILGDFSLSDDNGTSVAEVCRKLDGIPLAIELASARMRVLTVQQISDRLHDRFGLLTSGSRSAHSRQQTLANTIRWSYDLLDDSERLLFRRLSVFRGTFSLDAVQAITLELGKTPNEILDILGRLVAKSLVQTEQRPTELRYRLLESLREYGHGLLVTHGELAIAERRHMEYFLNLAELAEPELFRAEVRLWWRKIEDDLDNVRGALGWCLEHREADAGLRLAGALVRFWVIRGYFTEGRKWLAKMLELPGSEQRSRGRAKVLTGVASLAFLDSDWPLVQPSVEEAVALWREFGDDARVAYTQYFLARMLYFQGQRNEARALWEQGLALSRAAGDRAVEAMMLINLASVSAGLGHRTWDRTPAQYRHIDAETWMAACCGLEDGLVAATDAGYAAMRIRALSDLADMSYADHDLDSARALAESAVRLARETGTTVDLTVNDSLLIFLGRVATDQRDYQAALTYFVEATTLSRSGALSRRSPLALFQVARGLANLAMRLEAFSLAVELDGASAAWLRTLPEKPWPALELEWTQRFGEAEQALCHGPAAAAVERGEQLSLDQAVLQAVKVLDSTADRTADSE